MKTSALTVHIKHLQFLTVEGNLESVHAQLLIETLSSSGLATGLCPVNLRELHVAHGSSLANLIASPLALALFNR